MDSFEFFLGMFTVLFIISLILSYTNFYNFLKVKEKVNIVQRDLEDDINGVNSSLSEAIEYLEDNIDDIESDLTSSVENSTREIYAVITKIESKLDDIITRLEAEKK